MNDPNPFSGLEATIRAAKVLGLGFEPIAGPPTFDRGRADVSFECSVPVLAEWCRDAELALLGPDHADAQVLVAFQKEAHLARVARRFDQIAREVSELRILLTGKGFGPLAGAEQRDVAGTPFEREWVLSIVSEAEASLVAARELGGEGARRRARTRRFAGVCTRERSLVEKVHAELWAWAGELPAAS